MRREWSRLAVTWLLTGSVVSGAFAFDGLAPSAAPLPPLIAGVAGPPSMVAAPAAADVPPEMPPQVSASQPFDWNGWYVGGRVGLATGSSNWSATRSGPRAPAPSGSLDLFNPPHFSEGTGSYF